MVCFLCFVFAQEETWTVNKSAKKQKTLPKVLLMGKFNLSEALFEQALQDGDIIESRDEEDRCVYAWNTREHAEEKAKKTGSSVTSKGEAGQDQEVFFRKKMTDWKLGLFRPTVGGSVHGGKHMLPKREPLALMDQKTVLTVKQWVAAKEQLSTAASVFEKAIKEARKLVQSLTLDKNDELYLDLTFDFV